MIQIFGDYYHAHECRYSDHQLILGRSAFEIRCRDSRRLAELSKDFDVEVIHECEIKKMLKSDPIMQAYYNDLDLQVFM